MLSETFIEKGLKRKGYDKICRTNSFYFQFVFAGFTFLQLFVQIIILPETQEPLNAKHGETSNYAK